MVESNRDGVTTGTNRSTNRQTDGLRGMMRLAELLTTELKEQAELEQVDGHFSYYQVEAIMDGMGYVLDLNAFGPGDAERRAILALFVRHDEQLDIISVTD